MNYHHGPRLQRGRGLGSILAALFRGLAPVARLGLNAGKRLIAIPAVRTLGKTAFDIAKQGAVSMAADIVDGKNVKESAQKELNIAKAKIAQEIGNARSKIVSTLRGGKKRKKHMTKIVKNKRRKAIKYSLLD